MPRLAPMPAQTCIDPQIEVYRRMQPWQRLKAACELYWLAREIIRNREKRAQPDLSAAELEKRVRSFFR
jgi:Rv0078B-related antitoxin